MYLPRSKYTVSIAKSGEYTLNGESYVGPIITTYTGDVYAGDDIRNNGGELEKVNTQEPLEKRNTVYPVVPIKRVPTETEYSGGYMVRYFCQDKRTSKVFEISESSFDNVEYGSDLGYYRTLKITWYLTGPVAISENEKTVNLAEKALPGIISSGVLHNSEQFVRR